MNHLVKYPLPESKLVKNLSVGSHLTEVEFNLTLFERMPFSRMCHLAVFQVFFFNLNYNKYILSILTVSSIYSFCNILGALIFCKYLEIFKCSPKSSGRMSFGRKLIGRKPSFFQISRITNILSILTISNISSFSGYLKFLQIFRIFQPESNWGRVIWLNVL